MSELYLIIEAGSTKSDWALCSEGKLINRYKGKGINPSTLQERQLSDVELKFIQQSHRIHFYGAGVVNEKSKQTIHQFLKGTPKVQSIESDLMAVALGLSPKQDAILCILGTGSITALWKDKNIIAGPPSLGYLLSDEGGGVDIGKMILRAYFYGLMPPDVLQIFKLNYPNLNKQNCLDSLYKQRGQAAYLAAFAIFLTHVDSEDWKRKILHDCFSNFIQNRVHPIEHHDQYPIVINGSIAFHFKEELLSVFSDLAPYTNSISIRKSPMKGLIRYHSS